MLTSLIQRLEQGERDIDTLEADARRRLLASGDFTPIEVESVTLAVRRDLLEEFACSYDESCGHNDESVFLRVIKDETVATAGRDYRPDTAGVERGVRTLAIMAFTTAAGWSVWAIWCKNAVIIPWCFIPRRRYRSAQIEVSMNFIANLPVHQHGGAQADDNINQIGKQYHSTYVPSRSPIEEAVRKKSARLNT